MRVIERFPLSIKTNWSDWNQNDRKMIAVCGTESHTRLIDIRSGSLVHSIILGVNGCYGLYNHRATRCLWSKNDIYCLFIGDNDGFLHVYDTRHSNKPVSYASSDRGQISGMSFTSDQSSIITSQGTKNNLVHWNFNRCSLQAEPNKFRNPEPPPLPQAGDSNHCDTNKAKSSKIPKGPVKKKARRMPSLSHDVYLRCQFYVTDRQVYRPAPANASKCKEINIYDIESGYRIKSLRPSDMFFPGTYTVTGLLPESLVLYVGGAGRLRVWTLDEDYGRKFNERVKKYHTTKWDSDDESQPTSRH